MKISLLKRNLPLIGTLCLSIALLTACSDSNRSGNYSTMNTEVDTVGGIDNTQMAANTNTTDTVNRARRNPRVTVAPSVPAKPANPGKDAAGYYDYAETAPYYTGGNAALQTYFDNNLTYPEDAIDNNIEGTVMVRFTIDEDGTVQNATATGAKLGYGLEEEAVRVVNSMAAWTPGENNGKQVKAWYTLPVTFRLE
jgi:TonB family protein